MEVREADRSDLIGIGRVIHAAFWESYGGLLAPETIADHLAVSYAPSVLKRRLLAGGLLVAVDGTGTVAGCAIREEDGDSVEVLTLAIDPAHRRRGVGHELLEVVHDAAGVRPLSMRILLGSIDGELFAEREGFVPGEVLEGEFHGQQVVQRRWWFAS
jgi:N-acetylglutamate synthase-like GNAT family acetyltransferase